ncbi:hypothetical protein QJS04_geneDACA012847 [Acorus gramineus]|uniref:Uncharacterized protein n=1 Tax=Acorus gramineus TaxID=55184 RepID=A0AAV9BGU6_ACOGR|nr:hypothetical protein QJS04_geneDACA012847 [Acorus gramineus]
MQTAASVSDMVFGFFEGTEWVSPSSPESCSDISIGDDVEAEEEEEEAQQHDKAAFWEAQQQLLHAILSKTSSLEVRVRHDVVEAVSQSRAASVKACTCARQTTAAVVECWGCLLRDVSDRLRTMGHNSALCRSKWRSSPDIPSGEHSYIDVLDAKRGTTARVVIELRFRGEFEMARTGEDYNRLVGLLPEVFVGKAERLRGVIKIMCAAGKRCMKEKRMHMGPWRKHKYMLAKWFGACERVLPKIAFPVERLTGPTRARPPKASMLTFDLLEKLPGFCIVNS